MSDAFLVVNCLRCPSESTCCADGRESYPVRCGPEFLDGAIAEVALGNGNKPVIQLPSPTQPLVLPRPFRQQKFKRTYRRRLARTQMEEGARRWYQCATTRTRRAVGRLGADEPGAGQQRTVTRGLTKTVRKLGFWGWALGSSGWLGGRFAT
jgi:hypothetical protein